MEFEQVKQELISWTIRHLVIHFRHMHIPMIHWLEPDGQIANNCLPALELVQLQFPTRRTVSTKFATSHYSSTSSHYSPIFRSVQQEKEQFRNRRVYNRTFYQRTLGCWQPTVMKITDWKYQWRWRKIYNIVTVYYFKLSISAMYCNFELSDSEVGSTSNKINQLFSPPWVCLSVGGCYDGT